MESDFRSELIKSNEGLNDSGSVLHQVLVNAGYSTNHAYVLHWTPDQTEDVYVVLIGGSFLLSVEIDKFNKQAKPIVDRQEIKSYLHGLSRMHQVQLAVALDLANTKHNQTLNRTP